MSSIQQDTASKSVSKMHRQIELDRQLLLFMLVLYIT